MDAQAAKLLNQQQRFGGYIANFSVNCTKRKPAAAFTLADVDSRSRLLEDYWRGYVDRDEQLQDYADKLKSEAYFEDDHYTETSNDYLEAQLWLATRKQEICAASPPLVPLGTPAGQANNQSRSALETIKLPRFTGIQKEWDSFKDKFTTLIIHDTSIPAVCKFIRLTNCLGGEAAEKLQGITTFEPAWQALCSRYDNARLRFSTHMKTIVQLPALDKESALHINQLLNTISEATNTFKALSRPVDQWDDVFVYLVESKLAPETKKDWEKVIEGCATNHFPAFKELKSFLDTRVRTLDMIGTSDSTVAHEIKVSAKQQNGNSKSNPSNSARRTSAHVATQQPNKSSGSVKCTCCNDNHMLVHCKNFQQLSPIERKEHVIKTKLCFNCLSPKHMSDNCPSSHRCYVCNGKHHTRLHLESKGHTATSNPSNSTLQKATSMDTSIVVANHHAVSTTKTVLLSTACVTLCSSNGRSITVRALLDSGAEESFISETVVQALGVKKQPVAVAVAGVGGDTNAVARSRVSIILKSPLEEDFAKTISALVLKRLTAVLPRQEIKMQRWPHLENLRLADTAFGTPARVDCILNSAVYAASLRPGLRHGAEGSPTALASVFGWLIMGPATVANFSAPSQSVSTYHATIDHELSAALTRFWEIEEVKQEKPMSPDDEWCYNHFKDTYSRNAEGRFVVRLPFKEEPHFLGTKEIATSCFHHTERRFHQTPVLLGPYTEFMKEYQSLGHMAPVKKAAIDVPACYLPHHAVFKTPEKIRVVFNAAQKDHRGRSLNSFLHAGPKLQEDIVPILVRWSFLQHAFTCDIVKMFRQFLIDSDDTKWQRVLWRDHPEAPFDAFDLLTVTYGTSSAPFLANACMLQLANDEEHRYPLAAAALRKNRYMDDFFTGGGTLEETNQVREQLIKILAAAGMEVGKWAATNAKLLADVKEFVEKETVIKEDDVFSTLGLRWKPQEDVFIFQFTPSTTTTTATKRSILSETASLFDPIGWLSPIIVRAKILMQNLWLQGADWDTPLPAAMEQAWQLFKEQLHDLKMIRIPRWYGTSKGTAWQLHGFCDASQRAYAAALYIRCFNGDCWNTRLITAKSKVAPTKVVSLPRLELEGAVLLARLIKYIIAELESTPVSVHCWTDSQVVLAWLRAHPSRWKTSVANRVSEIVTSLTNVTWKHVRSADNPADLATRGATPAQLHESRIWWLGPAWLCREESFWPNKDVQASTELESKNPTSLQVFTSLVQEFSDWLQRFSSVDKVIRILAYVHRWRYIARIPKKLRDRSWLSASELAGGHTFLLRVVQRESFKQEYQQLSKIASVSPSSNLRRLTPFIDGEGLIRVGGRLQNSQLPTSERHPVILPTHHHITRLIIEKAHVVTMHGGSSLVQSHLSRRYWILRGRNTVRNVVRRCVKCTRYNAITQDQLMGPLPAVRTQPARPFTYTGLDYAGPFMIRMSPGRGQKAYKGYVAIFVCMVVKAVHLEVVSELTTTAFLAAFQRFTSRRGLPKIVFSDNATNFQGAENELARMFDAASALSQQIAAEIAKDNVEWRFIPPRAPNFGGLWEANVKAFKRHLVRVIGEAKLTFEEFSTVAAQIEGCLNSRPLSAPGTNDDMPALTPGHFLIGSALTAPPESSLGTNETESARSRWHLLSLIRNHFWQRWKTEYLSQLQQRAKWLQSKRNLEVGDIVLFKDELTPPTKWPLARVVKLHPGPDSLVRVVTVEMNGTQLKRPINKLVLLPVNENAASYLASLESSKVGGN